MAGALKSTAELEAEIARLESEIDDKSKPRIPGGPNIKVFSGGRIVEGRDAEQVVQNGAYSYWDTFAKPIHPSKAFAVQMPENYRPYNHFKSFGGFLRAGFGPQDVFRQECFKHWGLKSIQGMSTVVGAEGGFTVLPEFSPVLLEKVYDNNLWSLTDNYPVTGNNMRFPRVAESSRANGSRAGGVRGYWVDEGATIADTKPALGALELRLKKLAVVVYLTQELIDDAGMALEAFVARKVSEEFKFMLGDAFVRGNGVGQPTGILNAGCLISVAKESGQTAATIMYENVLKMYARMWPGSLPNARWYYNQDCTPQLNTMSLAVGTGGQPVYVPPGGASAAPYGLLMGRPCEPIEFCATCGTLGDLIFCDPSQYVTIGKGGIQQATSMHVEFLTDQLALRFTMRVDGNTWEPTAVTPYQGTDTISSFIALAARA